MKVYAGGWPSHDTGVAREGGVVHSSPEHRNGAGTEPDSIAAGAEGKCEIAPALFSAILARGWSMRLLQISAHMIYHVNTCEAL